jgi:hypothetical protein
VLEVLSPHPRIGKLDERVAWFGEYGVRECWLLHQPQKRVEVLGFADRRVVRRKSFDQDAAIESEVLPEFRRTLRSVSSWA